MPPTTLNSEEPVFHARRKDQSIEENSFFILTTLTKSY